MKFGWAARRRALRATQYMASTRDIVTERQPSTPERCRARVCRIRTGRRAVHRRRHLDRVRHPRLPLARRALDQEPADPVRRSSGQPGDARRGLAPSLRHGGAVFHSPARAAATWRSPISTATGKVPGVITQNIDNLHQASGIAAEDVSSCTAIPPMPTASTAAGATNSPGSRPASSPTDGRRTARIAAVHQDGDDFLWSGNARGRHAARARRSPAPAICSSRSVRRWWSGRPPGSR